MSPVQALVLGEGRAFSERGVMRKAEGALGPPPYLALREGGHPGAPARGVILAKRRGLVVGAAEQMMWARNN